MPKSMPLRQWSKHAFRLSLSIAAIAISVAGARADDNVLTYKGADREQKLLEGARAEGEVVLYSTIIVNQAMRPLADAFEKKYPFVKMTYWRGDSQNIFAKVSAEERASNVVADLLEGPGVGELVINANLAAPYTTPAVANYPAVFRDPRGLWTVTRLAYMSLAYNTKLVTRDNVPKTYEALLDPQWKGKMAWRIGSSDGAALFLSNLRSAWGEDKAMAYFQKLRAQNIINFGSGSARTLVDRVLAGEYPIALNIFAQHPLISAAKGAPVYSQLLDPVPTTASTLVIPKGARHPYASLLLADFILSKEGQETLAKAEYYPALPDVPAAPTIDPIVPQRAGYSENFIAPEKTVKYGESSEKIWEDLFR